MSFTTAVAFVLLPQFDGQPYHLDNGHPTAYGWDSVENPDLTDADLRAMTPERAAELYYARFWPAIKGDFLPEALQLVMLDTAVVEGPEPAIKFLQRALYVRDDGKLGTETLNAAGSAIAGPIIQRFTAERIFNLSTKETWAKDGKGWTIRALAAMARSL